MGPELLEIAEGRDNRMQRTFKNLWIRPTGNCKPALTERDVGFRLSPFFADIVPLAPLPERPLPDRPFAPLPDIIVIYEIYLCFRAADSSEVRSVESGESR